MTRVTVKKVENEFKPLEICITLESQKEVNALYCIFNSSKISRAMKSNGFDTHDIYKALQVHKNEHMDVWNSLDSILRD